MAHDLPQPQTLEIVFLDVGQGDAALVLTPSGQRLLIDAGPRRSGVAEYLRFRGIDTLELVVASHNHADHIGGMAEVFAVAAVRNYMENGVPSATVTYTQLVDAIERSGTRVLDATSRSLSLGDVTVNVLPGTPDTYTQNDRSVGLLLQYGEFRALFTGDAEQAQLEHWLAQDSFPRVSVVKVPHHGSRTGAVPDFARAAQPSVAIISLGLRNQYGHPFASVLAMWSATARHVLRTDQDGHITVLGAADGSMRLSTQRGRPPMANALVPARRIPGSGGTQ